MKELQPKYKDRYNKIFKYAEKLFGKCNNDWKFQDVIFDNIEQPHICYQENNQIIIKLQHNCLDNESKFIFQLAHEVCHTLHPTYKEKDKNVTTILDEGISTYFSIEYLNHIGRIEPKRIIIMDLKTNCPNYFEAYKLIKKLMKSDKDSIKKIRGKYKDLSTIKYEDLKEFNFKLEDNEIKKLCENFN